eukprot:gnl/MRDRNA2_/MRDRNA2_36054_c0_seq1.p1 gnl/MRDRNA2_/MRDRNA2_36054_c0~~gnl/MRDRNA2_/MRDRNA2_36054_c0_seq1.p1  ORF type:complete len:424 (-),score=61.42 gnl/MRDRNA2_/MRDRNA2_36054_c0_seq1:89-1360(-)
MSDHVHVQLRAVQKLANCCKDPRFSTDGNTRCRNCGKTNPVLASQNQPSIQDEERDVKRRRFKEAKEPARRSLQVPEEGVDFIQKLFAKGSTFSKQIHDKTACKCWLELAGAGRLCIMVEGQREPGALPDALTRIQSLFTASPEELKGFLSRCTRDRDEGGGGFGKGAPEEVPNEAAVASLDPESSKSTKEELSIPESIALHLMTPEHQNLIIEQSGADVEFDGLRCCVVVQASGWAQKEQVQTAMKMLNRVLSHCKWGATEAKVRCLLKPKPLQSVKVQLSAMSEVRSFERRLTRDSPKISIGKDPSNDIFIRDHLVSRQHCILELDAERGGIFVIDSSTNGTFLNGEPLPSKASSKVLLSHGDDLVLKHAVHDPKREFGWVVNFTEIDYKEDDVILQPPKRIQAWYGEGDSAIINQTRVRG